MRTDHIFILLGGLLLVVPPVALGGESPPAKPPVAFKDRTGALGLKLGFAALLYMCLAG